MLPYRTEKKNCLQISNPYREKSTTNRNWIEE